MTDETAPATPAAEPSTAPAVEPAKTDAVATEATVETTETAEAAETAEAKPEGEDSPAEGDDDKPKRLPRSQRDKRKISYLAGQNAQLQQELNDLKAQIEKQPKTEEVEPTLEAYKYDVEKYQDAKLRWILKQEFDARNAQQQQERLREQEARLNRGRVAELNEKAEALSEILPDFHEVLKDFKDDGGEFSQTVKDAIVRVGPELAYYLAKNPKVADELNDMEPIEAAIRIGELRPKLSLAQPKKQTTAPAPISLPKGGAAPAKTINELAKSDDLSAYVAARNAQDAAARR